MGDTPAHEARMVERVEQVSVQLVSGLAVKHVDQELERCETHGPRLRESVVDDNISQRF